MEKGKIAALAYFDIFSHPLTESELSLWRWSDRVAADSGSPAVAEQDGFYFFTGSEAAVATRKARFVISRDKLLRAKRIVKLFRLLPSVRMVAACNSLGYFNARRESDIDLFIITAPGKIWLTRFWLQAFLKLFRLRPWDRGQKSDGLCLTFFVSSDALDISSLRIGSEDVYLTYWITQLLPLYDPNGWYEKFLQANVWVKGRVPDFLPFVPTAAWRISPTAGRYLFSWFTWSVWERLLQRIQLKILPAELKVISNQDSRVVTGDTVLKFHGQEDRRSQYQTLWRDRISQHT